MSAIPIAPSRSPLGHLGQMNSDPLGFYAGLHDVHGDWVRFRFGPLSMVLVSDPEAVHQILRMDGDGFEKGVTNDALKPLLEHSIFLADGERWGRARRMMTPHFTLKALPDFAEVVARETAELPTEGPLPLPAAIRRMVLSVSSECFLGTDVLKRADVQADLNELWCVNGALQRPANWLRPSLRLKHRRLRQQFRKRLQERVSQLRQTPAPHTLLGRLVEAVDAEGAGLDDAQLVDEAMTLVLTGQECSAIATSWTLLLLAQDPTRQASLAEALDQVGPGLAGLRACEPLRAAVDEALRLYPPAWLLARITTREVDIGGHTLGKGQWVFMAPWVLHRHPDLWQEPASFRPERWTDLDRVARRAWMPFGVGPRTCLGMRLALTLTWVAVAEVLRTRQLSTVSPLRADPGLTLRPHDDNIVQVRPRSRQGAG